MSSIWNITLCRQHAVRCLHQFGRDDRGVIAMLFAILAVPLFLIIGLAIDYAQASSYQSSMQRELDEAAIAGASALAKSKDAKNAEAAARRWFNASKPTRYPIELTLSVDQRKGTVTADATSVVPMTFMAIAGFKELDVSANSVASAAPVRSKSRASRKLRQKLANSISDQDLRELIYRVEQVCYKLRTANFADKVPQCKAVFDGSFADKLKTKLAANGNAGNLLPAGVRLVK